MTSQPSSVTRTVCSQDVPKVISSFTNPQPSDNLTIVLLVTNVGSIAKTFPCFNL